jgi:hypothetical protein
MASRHRGILNNRIPRKPILRHLDILSSRIRNSRIRSNRIHPKYRRRLRRSPRRRRDLFWRRSSAHSPFAPRFLP